MVSAGIIDGCIEYIMYDFVMLYNDVPDKNLF